MQTAVPDVVDCEAETAATRTMYGFDAKPTATFGRQCLVARRLVEKGVRFVQIFHGSNGGAGAWDAHGGLKANHSKLCGEVDQPIAALVNDLKQRGLLDETIAGHRHRIRPHSRHPGERRPRPSSVTAFRS